MRGTNTSAFEWPGFNLVAAFENRQIEGLRQFVLDAWTQMTANLEFARDRWFLRYRA